MGAERFDETWGEPTKSLIPRRTERRVHEFKVYY